MDNDSGSSSDSSIDDHFEPPDKINFNSSFFNTNKPKTPISNKNKNKTTERLTSSDSDSDDDLPEVNDQTSAALLVQVMKNLEKLNSPIANTNLPSTSRQLSPKKIDLSQNPSDLLASEINDLLLKGESDLGSSNFHLANENEEENVENDDSVDKSSERAINYEIPKEGVAITLPSNNELLFNRRKKHGGVDLLDELRKKLNRRLRANQLFIHKVGLLCWLAHGFHINQQLNDIEVMSVVLSLIPQKICPKARVDLKYLEQFTKWWTNLIKFDISKRNSKNHDDNHDLTVNKERLVKCLMDKKVSDNRELILLFICALRAIGINCRLVISFYPPNLKPKHEDLFHSQNSKDDNEEGKEKEKKKRRRKSDDGNEKKKLKVESKEEEEEDDDLRPMKILPRNSKQATKIEAENAKLRAAEIIRSKYMKKNDGKKKFDHDKTREKNNEKSEVKSPVQVRQLRSRTVNSKVNEDLQKKSKKEVKKESEDEDFEEEQQEDDDYDEDEKKKSKNKVRKVADTRKSCGVIKNKRLTKVEEIDRRILSSDDETIEEKTKKKNILDNYLWVEVYVESEENWICVDVINEKIHCVAEIHKKLPTPVLYIIGFNSLGQIKDVTRRYCRNWLTGTRKQRVDENWWDNTLSTWKEPETTISKAEDESLAQSEMEQPLPKTISECKGHPLYVIARHLLKFEALYPPDCVPLGHLKNGDAIYSRHCVHTLRSRETWLRQARVVKPAQEPYKMVKSMPKYDKLSGQMIKNQPLELFGPWQTMAYDPPEAKNGKIPRNEYGNVDLFQKCMLPKGTVHIDLPGLFRVAKKLNIDCVPAVVGFNFGGRGAMPMTQGYIVCEEFEDQLREAWEEEQEKSIARAKEKREKRIWGNWRKLIRGLFIREKIAAKYDLSQDNEDKDDSGDEKSSKRPKKSDKRIAKKRKT